MPDLNGFLADSIKGLHLRGDGNGTIAGESVLQSTILTDAIRNITGSLGAIRTATVSPSLTGAFYLDGAGTASITGGTGTVYPSVGFDASKVVSTAGENRPVSAVGIWICRVSTGTAEQVLPNTAPSLTGGNTWGGSQNVQGNLTVSGKLEADIKPLLNATGNAPVSACRAWVNVDCTVTPANIKGNSNILSVIVNSTGDITLTFKEAMPHNSYAVFGMVSDTVAGGGGLVKVLATTINSTDPLLKTTTQVRIGVGSGGSAYTPKNLCIGVFC